MSLIQALRPYGERAVRRAHTGCEFCGGSLDEPHAHVADVRDRALACSCRACALLFAQAGAGGGRYRTVPERVLRDEALTWTEADWAALQIPVRLAFVFFSTAARAWIALYPGPAGTTEAVVPSGAWEALKQRSRLPAALVPDVEALVAWTRRGSLSSECYLVPITACYELTGRLRLSWKGIDGGDTPRAELEAFFGTLRGSARPFLEQRSAS